MGDVDNLPEDIIAINNIPHIWLFKQVSLVCHHGGAGTTSAGFRAGVPSFIIPFSNDQFAWAHIAYDLGVGSAPIYPKNLAAYKLIKAIDCALINEIIKNAEILGANISTENCAEECEK